jgi:hypothetical protein
MKSSTRVYDFLAGVIALGIIAVLGYALVSYAAVTLYQQTIMNTYENHTFFTATSTAATSTNAVIGGVYGADRVFKIAGAKHVAFYFSRGATSTNAGSSTFRVEVSPDGTNWNVYNTLEQNVSTTTYPAVLASVTVPSGTSTVVAYMKNLGFNYVRCIANLVTDGAQTCAASADF